MIYIFLEGKNCHFQWKSLYVFRMYLNVISILIKINSMLRCLIKEESMQIRVMYSFNILNEKLTHFFMVLWTLSHENEKSVKIRKIHVFTNIFILNSIIVKQITLTTLIRYTYLIKMLLLGIWRVYHNSETIFLH